MAGEAGSCTSTGTAGGGAGWAFACCLGADFTLDFAACFGFGAGSASTDFGAACFWGGAGALFCYTITGGRADPPWAVAGVAAEGVEAAGWATCWTCADERMAVRATTLRALPAAISRARARGTARGREKVRTGKMDLRCRTGTDCR